MFLLTVSILLSSVFFFSHAAEGESDAGWRILFDGKSLDGWEFRGKEGESAPTFEVIDGAIVGKTRIPSNPTAFVATTESFKDFELLFDCKVDKELNSGVQVRSTPEGTVRGAQVEIQNETNKTGHIYGQGMGQWLTEDIPKGKDTPFQSNEWNTFRVLVKGQNIKTWINDVPVTDTTNEKIAPDGVIALQVHGYPRGKAREAGAKEILSVAWKNIKIRVSE